MAGARFVAALLALIVAVVYPLGEAFAHGDDFEYGDPGYGMGYPMESDSMEEYCPGCAMMGGNGMMGSYGMGPGMMGGAMYGLELDNDQRKEIARIRSGLRKHNWALQGEILDEQEKLFELYAEETPDAKKIGAVFGKMFDLRRQMIEATIDAQNRQRAILTDEQREQLRKSPYGSRNGDYGHGPGNMGHHHGHHMVGE